MDTDPLHEIELLNIRVNDLFMLVHKDKPFYKDASTLISIAAFIFSFGTTVLSYYRTSVQDTQALRTDLLNTIQRLVTLPRENVAASVRYNDNPSAYAQISGNLNQENILLSKKADDIIRKISPSDVSSMDYLAVAQALANSRNFAAALADNELAVKLANTEDDEVGTLRTIANLLFTLGRPSEGRQRYQEALEIWAKYPGYDDNVKASVNLLTELAWANSEQYIGQTSLAKSHLDNAQTIASKMPMNGGDATKSILQQARNYLSQIHGNSSSAQSVSPNAGAFAVPAPGTP